MSLPEKCISVVLGLLLVACAFAQTYRWGEREGRRATTWYYEGVIGQRVDQGIKGYRRVQKIREQAEYRRGFDACQDQF